MSVTLEEIGILGDINRLHIRKKLEYEQAINLTLENEFIRDCKIGSFTYINPFGTFNNCSFGRFCSIAQWVIVGPGQHNTSYISFQTVLCVH